MEVRAGAHAVVPRSRNRLSSSFADHIDALMTAAVIVNPHSGPATRRAKPDEIGSLLSAAGVRNSVSVIGEPENTAQIARDAVRQGFETVVACGGDGTVSTIASALAGTSTALGIIPLGTLNHFAKDLHIPLDLAAAARVISQHKTDLVDAAEVNGRKFINNSSLGIYPNIVTARERHRRLGLNKWMALGLAIIQVLRRYPSVEVRIKVKGESIRQRTPFVFIGNNEYESRGLNLGTRRALNDGRLYLYVAAPVSRLGLVRMAIAALLGRLDRTRSLQVSAVDEAWIETGRRRVRVSVDGEVFHLHTPLHYVIRPRALKVIVP